ncbi:hypothetical protein OIU74_014223 [Salix koriyanagi]|uniref:Uncharacterized protein n=1 Tax=Salix koriyanagi TaxID=2511006 RepID=A0A9Q0PV72_9ROSI|nr:hypothetical protein OIU74_014223 [Salix koriyanagi]
MKIKNKGKVYPSPPPSSSSSSSSSSSGANRDGDVLSVLKLLPAAILALASVLSLEDREVLAYMITRSLKTTTTNNPFSILQDSKKKSSKKLQNNNNSQNSNHRAPIFDCDCFDCYRSYWFRWDSSPNRELVHQVIEAFEEHLTSGEMSRKNTKGKRRDKTGPSGRWENRFSMFRVNPKSYQFLRPAILLPMNLPLPVLLLMLSVSMLVVRIMSYHLRR